jgi:hypothetical protein
MHCTGAGYPVSILHSYQVRTLTNQLPYSDSQLRAPWSLLRKIKRTPENKRIKPPRLKNPCLYRHPRPKLVTLSIETLLYLLSRPSALRGLREAYSQTLNSVA